MTRLCGSIFVWLALAGVAHAEPKRAIVLPTQLNGFIPNRREVQKALEVLIENRLKRVRLDIEPNTGLTRDEAQCTEDACLATIADHHGVDVVVASRYINDEQRDLNAYHVWVRMFVRGETPPIRTTKKDCPYCSEDKATDLLAVTVAETLAGAPSTAPPDGNNGGGSHPPPTVSTTKKVLRGASIASAAVGVVFLGLGGWKASQNGDVTCSPDCSRRDTTAGQAAFFTIGAVAVAAAIPMAIIGWRSSDGKDRKVTVSPSGAGVQVRLSY